MKRFIAYKLQQLLLGW